MAAVVEREAEQGNKVYKSPKRILVRFFRRSRDAWKRKYLELKKEHKRLQNQVADVRRSREQWRQEAEAAAEESARLQQAVTEMESQLETAEKKGAHN